MGTSRRFRTWIALVGALTIGGIVAGGVVAAQLGQPSGIAELEEAIEEDPLVRVADIPAVAGARARGVFVQVTSTGHLCLWDAPSATSPERGGGCTFADDPLGGRELSASLGYEGGPAASDVTDARLMGLASENVSEVQVVMSDGTRRRIPLRGASISGGGASYGVFTYRFRPSDFRRGVAPTAVVAVNGAGREIGRQTTGFGG